MKDARRFDAVVVGAGPNGLAAGIELARNGLSVALIEAGERIGGGLSSSEMTTPGFVHDLCSAIHPLAVASPFFRSLDLERFGLSWIHPPSIYAHPIEDDAALAFRDLSRTADALGEGGDSWRRLYSSLSSRFAPLMDEILRPIIHVPRSPFLLGRFGIQALAPASVLAGLRLKGPFARALFGGIAAHSLISLRAPGSSAIALMLGAAGHSVGWPFPRGGAQQLANALAECFKSLGGHVETDRTVATLDELNAPLVLLDVTPRQFLQIAGARLSDTSRRRMRRYRYGPGVFKLDYALSEPVPWRDPACRQAGTVHLGGTLEEIVEAEGAVAEGRIPERPFVLTAQQSLFDETRAPRGKHTFWAYCHVPHGSNVDMTERIETQIERYAPGFRDVVEARIASTPADLERRNANLVGGDINGGASSLVQLLVRPRLSRAPYRTTLPGVYLCSASTPPGGGVHGMCGYNAARTVLKDIGAVRELWPRTAPSRIETR